MSRTALKTLAIATASLMALAAHKRAQDRNDRPGEDPCNPISDWTGAVPS